MGGTQNVMSPDAGEKDEVLTQVRREETAGIRILAYRTGEFAGRKGDPESRKSERMGGTQNAMSPDVGAKDEVLTQVRREETAEIRGYFSAAVCRSGGFGK